MRNEKYKETLKEQWKFFKLMYDDSKIKGNEKNAQEASLRMHRISNDLFANFGVVNYKGEDIT